MFRIRKLFDDIQPTNIRAIEQIKTMLHGAFSQLKTAHTEAIHEYLHNPLKHKYHAIVYYAEDIMGNVNGAALLYHEPNLAYCYMDYLASRHRLTGRGIGGALYQRVQEEAYLLKANGLFFECLPDDPRLCADPLVLKQNRSRLRFYESFGARPIVNTAYETPIHPGEDNPPYLLFDGLGTGVTLRPPYLKRVIESVLMRVHAGVCSPAYTAHVLASVLDDPVLIRPPRYVKAPVNDAPAPELAGRRKIALIVNDKHDIHHIRERGYVEAPVRISSIRNALDKTQIFYALPPKSFSEEHIAAVHAPDYISFLKRVCKNVPEGTSVYPYVFPVRNAARPPKELPYRAGYYCIDTFTPINLNAYKAARRAVDCTLTAAEQILIGKKVAYALVRPPGHHAESRFFGGFCYFNNAAIAAEYLCRHGKVAILDIDHHHGNGQQSIFYRRADVLTVSLHRHPRFAYPYFSGFSDEKGEGPGLGYNLNIPLDANMDGPAYMDKLRPALRRINDFAPSFLVLCLGFDTAKGDPTGSFLLSRRDFAAIGDLIGHVSMPMLIVQEGGYRNRTLGTNARSFFEGLWRSRFLG